MSFWEVGSPSWEIAEVGRGHSVRSGYSAAAPPYVGFSRMGQSPQKLFNFSALDVVLREAHTKRKEWFEWSMGRSGSGIRRGSHAALCGTVAQRSP